MKLLQHRVREWMHTIFPVPLYTNTEQRCLRFLEESTELVQALGLSRDQAAGVLDYVYSREIGIPSQEVGGTMITLAALCATEGLDAEQEAFTEYLRITRPEVMQKIQEKQRTKPDTVGGGEF